ncbi:MULTISPECIES: DUF4123 domain-containing protein [unclassified Janthinobacterium]|uniref:DUF4123 domain-containing protein n=1 Tax=unclassified Janthinobacterium TaxID=2610881 RepID=UPI0005664A71|nr:MULTISPECIES: DUF4123 domain-containing protein [unclassified Janthinobacterium]
MITHLEISNLPFADPSIEFDGQLYALIDNGGLPGLAKQLDRTNARWISLFAGSRDEGALAVAPLLILIDGNQNPFQQQAMLNWICEHGTFTSSILFMVSQLPMAELACRLALRLDATLPDNIDIVLRYFDARVFEQLMVVLSKEQKTAFLSVADRWWFVDRRGKIQPVDAVFSEAEMHKVPLSLTVEQEGMMLDASEPDQVAAFLRPAVPVEYANMAPELRYDFIVRHMGAARMLGIYATHELALYCLMALLHGEKFSIQAPWATVLGEVKSGKSDFTLAVAQMEFNDVQ